MANNGGREVTDRLQALASRYGQAELARRTGVSRQNVSRYLQGTRPPLDFGAELVRGLGVNPAWLLVGEGAPFLSDIAEGTGRLAGDLLEVVNALNAVARMRIGSLGGKHHLRLLRELGEAMQKYEVLRGRLNERGVPILRAVLQEFRKALDGRQMELARSLCRTAEQLGRFCDDDDLSIEFVLLHGRFERAQGNLEHALDLVRRAIGLTFRRGGLLREPELESVAESVATLRYWMRFAEAMRVARAAGALTLDPARKSPPALWLDALVGDIQLQDGELQGGVQALMRVRGLLPGERGLQTDGFAARALLMSGTLDVPAATEFGTHSLHKAGPILGFATFLEDAGAIETALAYWQRVGKGAGDSWHAWYARMMLRALRGPKRGLAGEVRRFVEASPGCTVLPPLTGPIFGAELYRLMGREADARRTFQEACRVIADLPPWLSLSTLWKARHMRNARSLGTPAQREMAREYFRSHAERGYACFAPLAA